MPLLPYSLIRPFAFCMNAEDAHDAVINLLAKYQNTPLEALFANTLIKDPITLAGITFPNRVGLAAGLDKNARVIDAFSAMGFGFIEVGSVTPLAQSGNPKPRMFRLPKANAIINRMGFNNEGLEQFIQNVKQSTCRVDKNTVIGINLGKNAATPIDQATSDYLTGLERAYPYADYIAINISSPNTQNLRALQSDEALHDLLHALNQKRNELTNAGLARKPIFVKIAPDLDATQIVAIAQALQTHHMDGVIATNTTVTRDTVTGLMHGNELGGLSGAPVRALSCQVISSLRQALGKEFPIIGVGGIFSGADALEKIKAGADIVQLYSGLIYKGPALVKEVAYALQQLQSR